MAEENSFPEEIFREILVRIPLQFLIKLKTVCKFWLALISDPDFINANISRHLNIIEELPRCGPKHFPGWRYFSVNMHDTSTRLELHVEDIIHDDNVFVHDSCNGLLLLKSLTSPSSQLKLYVCNPITRQYTTLFSRIQYGIQYWALVFDASNGKYKVIGISAFKCVHIFPLSCDKNSESRSRWRQLEMPHEWSHPLSSHIITNNELHWMVREQYVYSFDFVKEEFKTTQIKPFECKQDRSFLLELNGQLCIANHIPPPSNQLDIWTLVDSANCLWTTSYTIHLDFQLCTQHRIFVYGFPLSDYSCSTRILIRNGEEFFLFDLKSKGLSKLQTPIHSYYHFLHMNSLVSWK